MKVPRPAARAASVQRIQGEAALAPRLLCAALLGAFGPATLAQTADIGPPQVLDQVTVVGSRAKSRTVFDSTVPIDILSGRQLEQGLSTGDVGQALQNLSPAINMPRVSSSGTSDSIRVIQLRGLAPDQTLVLVNGKRRHVNAVMDTEGLFPGTVSVDLNTLPPNAIEAVEILRDGAGAQYGSDAIAGVVNIRLKRGASGGSASVLLGANHTAFAPTGQHITDGQTVTVGADQGIALGDGGFLRFGANVLHKNGTQRAGPTDASFASENASPADLALDGKVLFKSGDSRQDSGSLFYNAALPLGGGLNAYSFATAARRDSKGGAFYRYPGDSTNVPAVYPQGYRPETTGTTNDAGWVGGLKWLDEAWTVDGSLRVGANDFDYGVDNSLNASLGAGSPTKFHLARFKFRQYSANLDASRQFATDWTAEPVTLAFGVEAMHENFRTAAGDPASYAAGPVTSAPPGAQAGPGLRPGDAVDLGRNTESAYLDLDLPVTKALLIGAAARESHYQGLGIATTGKLSARYKLNDDWLVRGSVSNSFRAPALAQTGFRFATLNFNGDGTGLQNNLLLPAADPLARAFGATPLKPERSHNFSLGAAWRPAPDTTVTLDAYRIRIKGRITRTSDLQSDAVSNYLGSIGRGDVGSVAFLTNALDTTTDGIDLVGSHDLKLGLGRLRLNAALNLNRTRIDNVRNASPALAAIDPSITLLDPASLLVIERGSPRNKLVLSGEWSQGPWSALLRTTRFGEVYDRSFDETAPIVNGTGTQRFGATWSADLEVQYQFTTHFSLALGGNNIFDRYPHRTLAGGSYGGSFPYDYINPLGINGAFYYARALVTF